MAAGLRPSLHVPLCRRDFTFTENNITIRANDDRVTALSSRAEHEHFEGGNRCHLPIAGLTRRSTLTAGAIAAFAGLLGPRLAFADEKQ